MTFLGRDSAFTRSILTVSIMRVLHPRHGAATEHHLVVRQRARLVRKDVLHLAQILSDIQSPALQVRVRLLVIQIHVLMDEVDLADLHDLNRHEEGDGYQHLERTQSWLQGDKGERVC